jgi:hypothetical protein
MVTVCLNLRQAREAAYERAKARGDKAGARALLIELRKEREAREGRGTLPERR